MLLSMPKDNILERGNHVAVFDNSPKEFNKIPQNFKQRILQFPSRGWKPPIVIARTENIPEPYAVTRAGNIKIMKVAVHHHCPRYTIHFIIF